MRALEAQNPSRAPHVSNAFPAHHDVMDDAMSTARGRKCTCTAGLTCRSFPYYSHFLCFTTDRRWLAHATHTTDTHYTERTLKDADASTMEGMKCILTIPKLLYAF